MHRHIACLMYNCNVEKKDRLRPEEYMPLPGDEKERKKPLPPRILIDKMNLVFGPKNAEA